METILSVGSFLLSLFNLLLILAVIKRVNNLQMFGFQKAIDEPTLASGTVAPNFSAQTLDGRTITLQDYHDRDIALVFFAPNCEPCREKLLYLSDDKFSKRAKEVGLILVSLEDEGATREYVSGIKLNGHTVLVAPMDENPLKDDYMVHGTPFYCRVNSQGKVHSAGFLSNWREILA